MDRSLVESTPWNDLGIACPHCGNNGDDSGGWTTNAWVPFKLIEEVVRSFAFAGRREADGGLFLIADVETDSVDWESGSDLRIECMQCFGDFPIPEGAGVDFDS